MSNLPKGVKREGRVETFSQEMDSAGPVVDEPCAADEFQQLRVETRDAGVGPYLVISTERWAIDPDQIDAFAEMLRGVLCAVGEECKKGRKP